MNRRTTLFTTTLIASLALTSPQKSVASPFEDCPSKGFLIQDSVAKIYGVNLATGFYELLSDDLGTSSKLNAMGFNIHDNYLYAFSYEWKTLAKINSSYQATPLSIQNLPDSTFYVGDISLIENTYFAYRPGADYGLFRIDLEPDNHGELNATRIINGSNLDVKIYDFAFHPNTNHLYSVDRQGELIQINPATGNATFLGNVGETGTFGAVYFDADGRFYISRNSDGYIFRIQLDTDTPFAEFFAFGPSSGNNDGARCGSAPIISDTATIDFGSAPESYGSNIENNGARHEYQEGMHLGTSWGGNDDGITIISTPEVGMETVLTAQVEGDGYINVWADWDQNGSFSEDEHVIVDQTAQTGNNLVVLPVPTTAQAGETWSRVRFTSTTNVGANGGVSDGEVEDLPITVLDSGVTVQSYPGTGSFATVAFEDNWPEVGDYDMNDAVIALRTHRFLDTDQKVIRYDIEGKILALGASYHNGFAIQLDGVNTSNIDSKRTKLYVNGLLNENTPLEDNLPEDDAVIILFNDLRTTLPATQNCEYYRTQKNCTHYEDNQEVMFRASIYLLEPTESTSIAKNILNPFIFATPGFYHGDHFSSPPGRALEIHLKNHQTTARFDKSLFQSADDFSTEGVATFITENYMPWAIEFPVLWAHPFERVDLTIAYPEFKKFVESEQTQANDWFTEDRAKSNFIIHN